MKVNLSYQKLKTTFWKHRLLISILALGLFVRIYKPLELFYYAHDQDLGAWFYLDVFKNGHFRLIGQETSVQGVFIGPLFYYLLSIFYLLFNGSPIGGIVLVTFLGLFSIWSVYFVFSKIFFRNVGLIAALIYASSYLIIFADREVVPTQPVLLWTVWYFYAVWLVLQSRKLGFVLVGVLWGLIWHLNLGLAILAPMPVLAWVLSKKKGITFRVLLLGVLSLLVFSLPLIVFEIRHNFGQFQAIFFNTAAGSAVSSSFFPKFDRVLQLMNTNAQNLLWGYVLPLKAMYAHALLLACLLLALYKRLLGGRLAFILILWEVVYIVFFSFNKINVSEYYLNGLLVVWIAALALAANYIYDKSRFLGLLLVCGFLSINMYRFLDININKSGYLEKRALIAEINADAAKHNYSCISVSYITKPGYELGYRYLFYLENLHVNRPDSGSPVYTIVFPHSMVERIDNSFGALGLIYPDYEKYTAEEVSESCSGANSNLTDPLFGFTSQ